MTQESHINGDGNGHGHATISADDERRPLLDKKHDAAAEDDTTITHEARILLQYTIPMAAINILRTLVQTMSIFCLGRMGTRELASANLGLLTVNVLGYAIHIGLISSLDTLANQAIRSSSPKLTSIYTMRAFVVCCIVMPPMYLLLWNSRFLLRLILPNADPEMIRLAALYVKVSSLGIPPLAAFECLRRYLMSMGIMRGPTAAYAFCAPISVVMTYVFTFNWFGFVGAPLAVSVSYYVLFAVLAVYTWLAAPRHAWAGVSMIIFEDLGLNFRYGVAGVISTCSEWYAFEAMGLGATYLGEVTQAVNAIGLTLSGLCWQLPFAISQSVAIRIGNQLGANLPHKAKKASDTAQIFTCVVTGLTAILLQIFKSNFAQFFSSDPLVISEYNRVAWLVAIIAFFDGIQGACTGILKGGGLPDTASRINLFSYWVIGLPIGALVTLNIKQIEGLWTGLSIAVFFASLLMLLRIWTCNWEARAEEAQNRIANSDAVAGLSNIEIVPEA